MCPVSAALPQAYIGIAARDDPCPDVQRCSWTVSVPLEAQARAEQSVLIFLHAPVCHARVRLRLLCLGAPCAAAVMTMAAVMATRCRRRHDRARSRPCHASAVARLRQRPSSSKARAVAHGRFASGALSAAAGGGAINFSVLSLSRISARACGGLSACGRG